ncbi:hypothetical protein ACFL2V_17675 [Pseudomonadota bacterium]
MIKQLQQQLRDLNQAYFNGQLSFGDYRQKRGLMLDALFEDTTVRDDFTPKTVPMQKVFEKTQELKPPVGTTSEAPEKPQPVPVSPFDEPSSNNTYMIIGAVALCVVIAAVVLMSGGSSEPAPKTTPTNASLSSSTTPDNSLQAVVEKHLQNNSWTPEQLREIEALWKKKSADEKTSARQSAWHHKLNDALRGLASEQKALVDLGNQNAAAFELQINRLVDSLKYD